MSKGKTLGKVRMHFADWEGIPWQGPHLSIRTILLRSSLNQTKHDSIRIVIWILPSDTLFGDDLYCICFDQPNRETAMLFIPKIYIRRNFTVAYCKLPKQDTLSPAKMEPNNKSSVFYSDFQIIYRILLKVHNCTLKASFVVQVK